MYTQYIYIALYMYILYILCTVHESDTVYEINLCESNN